MKALSGGRVFGLEVQDYHLEMLGTDAASLLGELRALGFTRFVILNRNPIRKLVSHIAATTRGQHHAGVGETVKAQKVSIDCDRVYVGHRFVSLEGALEQFEAFFDAFEEALEGEEVLRLSYAAHVEASPLVAYEAICGYLGLTPEEPAITLRKTTNRNLADVIENYAEFEARVARSRFAERPVDLALAKEALGDITPSGAESAVTLPMIISVVTDFYNVRLADLQSKRRQRSIAQPRQVCMWLARQLTTHSLEEVGGSFGGRDHTTVMHAVKTVEDRAAQDAEFKAVLDTLLARARRS